MVILRAEKRNDLVIGEVVQQLLSILGVSQEGFQFEKRQSAGCQHEDGIAQNLCKPRRFSQGIGPYTAEGLDDVFGNFIGRCYGVFEQIDRHDNIGARWVKVEDAFPVDRIRQPRFVFWVRCELGNQVACQV